MELKSKCCGAEVKRGIRYIQYVDDGLVEYTCTKCHKKCWPSEVEAKEESKEGEK